MEQFCFKMYQNRCVYLRSKTCKFVLTVILFVENQCSCFCRGHRILHCYLGLCCDKNDTNTDCVSYFRLISIHNLAQEFNEFNILWMFDAFQHGNIERLSCSLTELIIPSLQKLHLKMLA